MFDIKNVHGHTRMLSKVTNIQQIDNTRDTCVSSSSTKTVNSGGLIREEQGEMRELIVEADDWRQILSSTLCRTGAVTVVLLAL